MWISAATVILTIFVLLEPVDEVEAGHSRLVIHTPQRVKVVHRYHTSEHYAKDYGYGEDWQHKPKKPRRSKGHRSHKRRSRRGRYRKRYLRKIGRRTPYTGGRSYGMYNYAKNYRNWTPQRRPRRRYRDSYLPIQESQEDDKDSNESSYHDEEDSSIESRPFENEIHAIDHYAQRTQNHDRRSVHDNRDRSRSSTWNQGDTADYVNRNSHQEDNVAAGSHIQGYSTLPDEFINTHSSAGSHTFQQNPHSSLTGQEVSFKNQNAGGRNAFRFNTQNHPDGENVRVNNFHGGQNPPDRNEFQFGNQNLRPGQDFRFNNQKFPGRQESRFNNQNIGGHVQNSAGRFNGQKSVNGQDFRIPGPVRQDTEPSSTISHDNSNNNRPHREIVHTFGGDNFAASHPNPDDLYYKAFRSFSFRKNPVQTSSNWEQTDSFSNGGANSKDIAHVISLTHQAGTEHNNRQNNQWLNHGAGENKDHDIGFLEGLEDMNDGLGI